MVCFFVPVSFLLSRLRDLLNPPTTDPATTDQLTTDHLLTDLATTDPPTHPPNNHRPNQQDFKDLINEEYSFHRKQT